MALHLYSGPTAFSRMSWAIGLRANAGVYLRGSFHSNSIAVLACPLCGTPSLITSAQYSGAKLFGARQGLAPDGVLREQRHVSLQRFMRLREPVQSHITQHQRLQQVG